MDKKTVKSYIDMFEKSSLSELEFSSEEFTIRMKKQSETSREAEYSQIVHRPEKVETKPETTPSNHRIITSPIVGTFYRTPSPDSPPYVEVGDTVEKGDIVCTLEAMKLMNQLEAEYRCEIIAILATQGSMVEYGQPLFEVKPL
ncbi:acetyl-CoA carboxylase biotin carboxyl carrier protein [Pleomorphochaeta sp. DL1XJH-081]|jgi:acetyl-CoA carboxylase biotin carboxyl carrier protein|uniref:acetyl-CoA carboxylase biotin carboxyl carrier protein n=1 Tax=Pleomorphochaeta sp. DL1XJH-081 TaxID=3409690 RepID=UPI003BB6F4EE